MTNTGVGIAQASGAATRTAHDEAVASSPGLSSDEVWHAITKASFAVLGYETPSGEPRSSGVVYETADRRLYVAVAPDSWKAKHVAASGRVAVTVTVRRGGLLSLVTPILGKVFPASKYTVDVGTSFRNEEF